MARNDMSDLTVCLGTSNTLRYPQGGHLWVFLNWAAGFRAQGARVIWLDVVDANDSLATMRQRIDALKARLAPFDLASAVALITAEGTSVPDAAASGCLGADEASSADLLFDLRYDLPASLVKRFRRTAFLDIDPGILQLAMSRGRVSPAPHDVYFSIGETVGQPGSRVPWSGLDWVHVPPCVSTADWQASPPPGDGAFTTVSHWDMNEWIVEDDGSFYKNDKRSAFVPFVELPRRVRTPLELAIHLAGDEADRRMLEAHGWRVREAHEVASLPLDFQRYVQSSRGEFGCAKPAYVKMQTSWISDRSLCYLASGRPVIVQNPGPTRYLSGREGVLRFDAVDDAVECFRAIDADYRGHCAAARALAEEHFSASRVAATVLERCA
jgi:hypothetical protein